jgi:hypothetical protein
MRIGYNDDSTIDEVFAQYATVYLEDMGDAYMLIVEDGQTHLHLTIPHPRKGRAFIYEGYNVE